MKNFKITADLVPQENFHRGCWVKSDDEVKWYYYIDGKSNSGNIESDDFINTVDKELKPIVNLLHKNNIKTSPSCAGHFAKKKYFYDIWNGLKNHEDKIKTKGIILKDPENNNTINFKDINYSLPWIKRDFVEKAYEYQKKGVIGFYKSNSNSKKFCNWLSNTYSKSCDEKINIKQIEKDNIVLLITNPDDKKELEIIWKKILKDFSDYFNMINEIKTIIRNVLN